MTGRVDPNQDVLSAVLRAQRLAYEQGYNQARRDALALQQAEPDLLEHWLHVFDTPPGPAEPQ